jgi:hypothetical protein
VIHRVLENPRTGLVHARLIAAHHRNPVGLEAEEPPSTWTRCPCCAGWPPACPRPGSIP